MKNLVTILLCICVCTLFSTIAFAQSSTSIVLDASSLTPVNTDAVTGLAIDPIGRDRSNRECARIMLHINRMTPEEISQLEIVTKGGIIDVRTCVPNYNGTGLIIELTAKPETRFYLYHKKYGDSNEVTVSLEGNREYTMNAWNETKLSIVVAFPESGAEVYLDEAFRGFVVNNLLTVSDLTLGHHDLSFRYSAGDYSERIYISPSSIYFEIDPEKKGQDVLEISEQGAIESEETADSSEMTVSEIVLEMQPKTPSEQDLQPSDKQKNKKVRTPVKGKTLLMASAGVFPQMSYGAMVGYVKRIGAYAKFRSNYNFITPSYSFSIGDNIYTSGKDPLHHRTQASAGLLFRLSENIYPYVGAGYSEYITYWEDYEGKWAQVTDYSCKGFSAEAGLAFRFGGFSLSVGTATTAFKYTDFEIGIGLMF